MPDNTADAWLARVHALQAIAQEGLTYAASPFDIARYTRLREIVADLAEALDDAHPSPLRLAVEHGQGYLTPKLDVRAAVFDDAGRLLFVRETVDDRWTLPGGWADIGQTLAQSAVREVVEESGFVVEVDRLLGVYDKRRWGAPVGPHFTLTGVVACRVVGGAATTSVETTAVDWFGRDEVPALSTPRTPPALIARIFEHADDRTLPPDL